MKAVAAAENSLLTTTFLVLVLCCWSVCYGKWTPSTVAPFSIIVNGTNNTVTPYSAIDFPRYAVFQKPEERQFTIFYPTFDTEWIEMCQDTKSLVGDVFKAAPFSCIDFFCGNQTLFNQTVALVESDFKRIGYPYPTNGARFNVTLHNYCYYCINSSRSLPEFQAFHTMIRNNSCPQFTKWDTNGDWEEPCDHKGRVVYHEEMVRRKLPADQRWNRICYCPEIDKYSFKCDAYATYWQAAYYVARPWVLFGLSVLVGVAFFFISCLPDIYFQITRCYNYSSDTRFSRKSFLRLIESRVQIITFLFLATVFYCLEQVLNFTSNTQAGSPLKSLNGGIMRIIALLFYIGAYSSLLVLWMSILDNQFQKRRLMLKHKIILIIFYTILIITGIVAASLSGVPEARMGLYISIAILGFIYLLIFPIGFSAYAIKAFLTLRRANATIKITDSRMMIFMMITNVFFALITIMVVIGLFTFIMGWDVFGEWLGFHRTIFLDLGLLVLSIMLIYMTYHEELFYKLYGKNCLVKLKLMKERDDI